MSVGSSAPGALVGSIGVAAAGDLVQFALREFAFASGLLHVWNRYFFDFDFWVVHCRVFSVIITLCWKTPSLLQVGEFLLINRRVCLPGFLPQHMRYVPL